MRKPLANYSAHSGPCMPIFSWITPFPIDLLCIQFFYEYALFQGPVVHNIFPITLDVLYAETGVMLQNIQCY